MFLPALEFAAGQMERSDSEEPVRQAGPAPGARNLRAVGPEVLQVVRAGITGPPRQHPPRGGRVPLSSDRCTSASPYGRRAARQMFREAQPGQVPGRRVAPN